MTIQQLNNNLEKNLKSYIKKEELISSGKLYNSIKFKCTYKDFDLKIKLDAKEYIKYVDRGDVLNYFFKLDSTKEIIQQFYASKLLDEL